VDFGREEDVGPKMPIVARLNSDSVPCSILPRSISAPSALNSWMEGQEAPPAVVRVQEPVAGDNWGWCVPGGLSREKDWVIFVYERVKEDEGDDNTRGFREDMV